MTPTPPTERPAVGLERTASPSRTRKIMVELTDGAWQVTSPDAGASLFPDRANAVAFACQIGRDPAGRGAVGLVVVKGNLPELHCFTPGAELRK